MNLTPYQQELIIRLNDTPTPRALLDTRERYNLRMLQRRQLVEQRQLVYGTTMLGRAMVDVLRQLQRMDRSI